MNPKREGASASGVSEIEIIGFEGRRRGCDEESVEERGREVSLRIGE